MIMGPNLGEDVCKQKPSHPSDNFNINKPSIESFPRPGWRETGLYFGKIVWSGGWNFEFVVLQRQDLNRQSSIYMTNKQK